MDKQENNMILTKRDDGSTRATSQSLWKKEQKIDHWNNKMEKKIPTSATNELGKHPSKKVIVELLETNNETNKLVVGLWKTSHNSEVTTGH